MFITDSLSYIGNPVKLLKSAIGRNTTNGMGGKTAAALSKEVMPALWKIAGRNYNFVRLGGLSGASAVILGAIGSHKFPHSDENQYEKTIFETANRFHFFHSLALLGMPLVKRPLITGSLLITGTLLFSGTLYYRAWSGGKFSTRLAPIGGSCLILAWLSMLL